MIEHIPVLAKEVCSFCKNSDLFVADLTLGLGGHSAFFLQNNSLATIYGVDRDEQAIMYSKQKLDFAKEKFFFFKNDFYSQVSRWRSQNKKFDFIFTDLGVCSLQLDQAQRGFSFAKDGKLDMRMDITQELSAYEVVNLYSQKELEKIFFDYGEEARARFFVKKILLARQKKFFETSLELGNFIAKFAFYKKGKRNIHPATKIFQAIRIEVNQELELLEKMLSVVLDILTATGRLAIISFHSLEDRIVKRCFQNWCQPPSRTPFPFPQIFPQPVAKNLTKKPITPSAKEVNSNPRARSAKLRVIEKL